MDALRDVLGSRLGKAGHVFGFCGFFSSVKHPGSGTDALNDREGSTGLGNQLPGRIPG